MSDLFATLTETRRFGPYTVELSSLDKTFFPGEDLGKSDVVDYYDRVAEHMVPHLEDRPLTMHRFPDGIDGDGFFQQKIGDHFPDWIERVTVERVSGGEVDHVVCRNRATLVYLANQGCLTLHVWLARTDRLHHPDLLVLDLDPSDDDFEPVRRAALDCRDLLEELGLRPFVKSTGSRGVHVVTPLDRSRTFDEVRFFARDAAGVLADRYPDRLTVEQRKASRDGRLFIDTGRNAYGQHAVAPYALRALPGAPVAAPLAWEELEAPGFSPRDITLGNLFDRLSGGQDPWHGMARHARSLDGPVEKLEQLHER